MDLRKQKTLSSIHNAFIELRSKKPLSRITVKELAQKALISKPTFYLHYKDIYDLSETLENEVITNIISSCPLNIEDGDFPYANWMTNLIQAFISQGQLLNILFADDRKNEFVTKLNHAFKEQIYMTYPYLRDNDNLRLFIDYSVYGTFHAYIQNTDVPQEVLVNSLVVFCESFLDSVFDLLRSKE